jgi:hypothetical protein
MYLSSPSARAHVARNDEPAPSSSPLQTRDPVRLMSREAAASYLGVQPQTLACWASSKRVQIPYVKIGRRVMYRRIDLDAFCAANVVGATKVGGAA